MAVATTCRVGQLLARNSALFICDIQEKFRTNIQYFNAIATVSGRLLDGAKLLQLPVVVTEQYPKGLGNTAAEIGLAKYPDIVPVEKTQFSMMTSSVVDRMAKEFPEVKSVVLCGIEAHVCVQGTALALLERGFDVHVVVDATSSRTQVDRAFAFQRMRAAGAWLTTSEAVLLGLVGDAKHPQFKAVQKLILESAPDSGLLSLLSSSV